MLNGSVDTPSLCFADDRPDEMSPLPMLIGSHQWACDYTRDLDYHKRGLDDAKKRRDRTEAILQYHQLGVCYSRLGGRKNYKTARRMFEEAHYLAIELGQERNEAVTSMNIGYTYYCEEKYERAISEFKTARAYCEYIESCLEKEEWPWHLDWVLKVYSPCLDMWVDTAIRLGKAEEALAAEELRRWRCDMHRLVYFHNTNPVREKKNYPGRTVTVKQLAKVAQSIKASFLVVFRVCRGALLTWVLSGETGGVIYYESQNIPELDRWIEAVACRKWWPLQEAIVKTREEFKSKGADEGLSRELCEKYMTDQVRGQVPEDLWKQLREPEGFSRELEEKGQLTAKILEEYYLKEAQGALEKLQKALWKPIVRNCKPLLEKTANQAEFKEPVSRHASCALKIFCDSSSRHLVFKKRRKRKHMRR